MIGFVIGDLVGLVVGVVAGHTLGWNAHVDQVEAQGITKARAQAEQDRRGAWASFVAVGVFVVVMVALGMAAR